MPAPPIDIRPDHLKIVCDILQTHVPKSEVWAFGSRAKWTAKEYSDLDLCIVSDRPLGFSVLGALADDFSESDLPYKVDIVDWATTSESFRKIIERGKVVVQSQNKANEQGLAFDMRPLGDYVSLLSGNTPSKANAAYWGGSTPWVSAKDMSNFWIDDAEDHLTTEGVAAASRLVPAGTVLMLTRGMTLHKRVPICRVAKPSTFNQDVKAVLPKRGISARFLPYLLVGNHDRLHERVDSAGHGTGRLNTDALLSFPVYVPDVPEQESIADIGEAIDERLRLLRETNATLEAIAQALFKSWFVDFDPVRAKADGREPEGVPPEVAELFPSEFEESELGEIPKGWRVGSLVDLSDLNPESWTAKAHPPVVAYIDLANTKDNEICEISGYTFENAPCRARRALRHGDTIIGTVRPGNRSFAFIHKPASNLTASTGFAVLRPKRTLNTEFVYLSATQESSIEHLAHVADGGAYPAVRPEVVAGLPCVVPSEDVMQTFHGMVAPLLAMGAENRCKSQTLATLRGTLLPPLISGKLRIPRAPCPIV